MAKQMKETTKKATLLRPLGRTLGLGVKETWIKVLKDNETNHLSDEKLTAFMKKEFPNSANTRYFEFPQGCRATYNRGAWTKGVVPGKLLHRYDAKGNRIEVTRGRPSASAPAKKAPVAVPTKKATPTAPAKASNPVRVKTRPASTVAK